MLDDIFHDHRVPIKGCQSVIVDGNLDIKLLHQTFQRIKNGKITWLNNDQLDPHELSKLKEASVLRMIHGCTCNPKGVYFQTFGIQDRLFSFNVLPIGPGIEVLVSGLNFCQPMFFGKGHHLIEIHVAQSPGLKAQGKTSLSLGLGTDGFEEHQIIVLNGATRKRLPPQTCLALSRGFGGNLMDLPGRRLLSTLHPGLASNHPLRKMRFGHFQSQVNPLGGHPLKRGLCNHLAPLVELQRFFGGRHLQGITSKTVKTDSKGGIESPLLLRTNPCPDFEIPFVIRSEDSSMIVQRSTGKHEHLVLNFESATEHQKVFRGLPSYGLIKALVIDHSLGAHHASGEHPQREKEDDAQIQKALRSLATQR